MKKTAFIILSLLLIGTSVKAQFAKPLPVKQTVNTDSEATFSVGIIGGVSSTRWFYYGGTETNYEQPFFLYAKESVFQNIFNNGMAGLIVEYKLSPHTAIGLEGLAANRSTMLSFNYELPDSIGHNSMFHRQDSILYHEINIQVPFTYYITGQDGVVRPYVFVAPRVTIPFSGSFYFKHDRIDANGNPINSNLSIDEMVEMTAQNMSPWELGAVVGAGVLFKIKTGNYYFNVKLDASCHANLLNVQLDKDNELRFNFLNTFSQDEIDGLSQNIIGAPSIDPTLLGKRLIGDASVRLTLLFPLKKMLKDACNSWGEYD